MKQITTPSSMHEIRHSKPVPWDDPEGWDGEGGKWEETRDCACTDPMADLALITWLIMH